MVPTLSRFFDEPEAWAMLLFFVFSILSLAMLPILIWMLRSSIVGADLLPAWGGLGKSIGKYMLLVYSPIAIGVTTRALLRGRVTAHLKSLGKLSSAYTLFALMLFAYQQHALVLSLDLNEYVNFGAIEAVCISSGLVIGRRYGGPVATRALATAMRNFAMALAFASVMLPHTNVTLYIIVFSIASALLAVFALIAIRLARRMIG